MIDHLSEPTDLGVAGEQAWQSLRQHTEWTDGFWIAWLFTGYPPLALEYEARMEALLRERGQRQVVLRPNTPDEARGLLEAILADGTRDARCVWVEIIRSDGPALGNEPDPGPWSEAWDWLMMRANERRTALAHHLSGGLVFVGPPAFKDRARRAAPDLWSIRALVLEPAPPPMRPVPGMLDSLSSEEVVPDVDLALVHATQMRARGLRRDESKALMRAARGLLARGETVEALRRTHEAVDAAGELESDPETAWILDNLAMLLYRQGALAEARPLLERALAIQEEQLGPDHPGTATSLNNMAVLLHEQGALVEARPLYERALAIRERQLGREHPDTATNLNSLARLLHDTGALTEARPLFERALTIRENQLGPEHPDAVTSLNSLARLLHDDGALAEARPLLERALAIREKQFGREHPYTAVSLNNLAGLLYEQGALAEARPLYERALAIWEKRFGPEHPDTATSLNNLAALLWGEGDLANARVLYERALAIREKQLGPEHPSTAQSLNNLAGVLHAQGAFVEARSLLERAFAIREKQLGPEHPHTAWSLNSLATVLQAQGALAEARMLYERALVICEARLGPDHPSTRRVSENLQSLPEP
jgi:tetratricopeptide (TPR) repeat protein